MVWKDNCAPPRTPPAHTRERRTRATSSRLPDPLGRRPPTPPDGIHRQGPPRKPRRRTRTWRTRRSRPCSTRRRAAGRPAPLGECVQSPECVGSGERGSRGREVVLTERKGCFESLGVLRQWKGSFGIRVLLSPFSACPQSQCAAGPLLRRLRLLAARPGVPARRTRRAEEAQARRARAGRGGAGEERTPEEGEAVRAHRSWRVQVAIG